MSKKTLSATGRSTAMPAGYADIRGGIVELLDAARHAAARSVNALMMLLRALQDFKLRHSSDPSGDRAANRRDTQRADTAGDRDASRIASHVERVPPGTAQSALRAVAGSMRDARRAGT